MIALFCMLMLIMHMVNLNLNLYYLFYKKKYNYLLYIKMYYLLKLAFFLKKL